MMPKKISQICENIFWDRTHQKPGGHILTGKNRTSISHAMERLWLQFCNQCHSCSIVWERLVRFFPVNIWPFGFWFVLFRKIFSQIWLIFLGIIIQFYWKTLALAVATLVRILCHHVPRAPKIKFVLSTRCGPSCHPTSACPTNF